MTKHAYATMILLISSFSSSVFALPFQYTFVGDIDFIINGEYDSSGNISLIDFPSALTLPGSTEYAVRDQIQYDFRVDFLEPGSCFDPTASGQVGGCSSASMSEIVEPSGATFNYFESSLISASNSTLLDWYAIDLAYGLSWDAGLPNLSVINGESAIYVEGAGQVDLWAVGMSVVGYDVWNTSAFFGQVVSDMTLTAINPLPVSEPKTIIMLLLGLGLLGFNARHRA